ncbi:DNA topoisomerase IB [Lutibaculum baratangense]|uniref:DNA topoisomerase n=1 Tax=Lutibaculum baratangense AMV1 TaxID=631454 RepID=V4RJT2_9HYPH|nr:DNA topoisomerase IB [Lutibaculum baratangense]ESR23500.1 hypothetical protein N177_3568 [Lutibaculum baratangense AMV1]
MIEPALSYASDEEPGFRRKRSGKGFAFYDCDGKLIKDEDERARIRKLAIPPAWENVWICPDPSGHIQATGRDAKGRKQYIYHPEYRAWREHHKFAHILQFAVKLPELRQRVRVDLAKRKLSRELVLATAVRMIEQTLIRVGNDVYAKQNKSYGLTTLRQKHLDYEGHTIRLHFTGKSGQEVDTTLRDRRVETVLRKMEGLPGQHLFKYVDEDGEPHRIQSADVNEYIRETMGEEFSAKDFRTWAATVFAALALLEYEAAETKKVQQSNIKRAIERVSRRLGNTPSVCRKSYVHPEVIEGYVDGTLAKVLKRKVDEEIAEDDDLSADEKAVLKFLSRRIEREAA